ncbi:MAG: hypothetical protein A2Y69_05025 [Candidatus Aminicenantes bacterium RBG_13_59_9]|nr:MAG: hypothetical protein A2Y69_05025 [Candidatus Aminicenantes bacterium RBG_13_59_9]
MNISKPLRFDGDVVVRVWNGFGGTEDFVVRKMDKVLQLEGKDYHRYQIVQPQGYEEEEIFHRPDRGREALLSVVFITLADSARRRQINKVRA